MKISINLEALRKQVFMRKNQIKSRKTQIFINSGICKIKLMLFNFVFLMYIGQLDQKPTQI
jgi:hypothetical protein